jgi:serine/threonine protein kinase
MHSLRAVVSTPCERLPRPFAGLTKIKREEGAMEKAFQKKELKIFQLSILDTSSYRVIGAGANCSVIEVAVAGTLCAAKHLRTDISDFKARKPNEFLKRFVTDFTSECELMSTLRHPNIVQFMGVAFFPGSPRPPALVMELMLTSLHELLDRPEPPFFPLSMKCSVLHNVASGLAYLHERTEPIIHRNLAAKKILLNSGMIAKIADLAVARTLKGKKKAHKMTKAPGDVEYMPPEAFADTSNYDTSIDIFSLGVLAIFTVGEVLPTELLSATEIDENGVLIARRELQRRSKYMINVNDKLRQFSGSENSGDLEGHLDHPVIQLIHQCLENNPHSRPKILVVLRLLEKARDAVRDKESQSDKPHLLQALLANEVNHTNILLAIKCCSYCLYSTRV